MTIIGLILGVKIAVTALLTAAPFLLLPEQRLAAMFRVSGDGAGTIFRLYGVAILALLVGYASGFWTIAEGRFPWGVVAMGLVSNTGAALLMFLTGAWRRAKSISFFVAAIAVALAIAAVFPRQALAVL